MNVYEIASLLLINFWFILTTYHFHNVEKITTNDAANNIGFMTLMSLLMIYDNVLLYFIILITKIIFNLCSAFLTYEVGGFIRSTARIALANNVVYLLSLMIHLFGVENV